MPSAPRSPAARLNGGPMFACMRNAIAKLRKIRRERRISLLKMSDMCGISNRTLCLLERDQYPNPMWQTVVLYAAALGVTFDMKMVRVKNA